MASSSTEDAEAAEPRPLTWKSRTILFGSIARGCSGALLRGARRRAGEAETAKSRERPASLTVDGVDEERMTAQARGSNMRASSVFERDIWLKVKSGLLASDVEDKIRSDKNSRCSPRKATKV